MDAKAGSSPQALLRAMNDNPKARPRDLAAQLGVTEADLVAARVGQGATRIDATPDALVPRLGALGPVMALTRNESAVSEKTGVYDNYKSGAHASMVLKTSLPCPEECRTPAISRLRRSGPPAIGPTPVGV